MARFDKSRHGDRVTARQRRPKGHAARSTAHFPDPSNFRWTLIMFAKAPIPGQVKTRLCPPLTPDEAATLHGSLVMDTIERSQRVQEITRVLACAPMKEHPFFQALSTRHRIVLWDQVGDNLGARLHHAIQTACDRGAQAVVVVGTDLPALEAKLITQALDGLATHDLVIGPTVDGGYYLIALNAPAPSLFANIPWSTDQVFSRTHQAARELGFSIACLPQQRDLDTMEDLQVFMDETRTTRTTTISSRTARVLKTLASRLTTRE